MRLQAVPFQLNVVVERLATRAALVLLAAGVPRAVAAQAAHAGEAAPAELAPVAVEAAVLVLVSGARGARQERLLAETAGEPVGGGGGGGGRVPSGRVVPRQLTDASLQIKTKDATPIELTRLPADSQTHDVN